MFTEYIECDMMISMDTTNLGRVAQLEEQLTCDEKVVGSTPSLASTPAKTRKSLLPVIPILRKSLISLDAVGSTGCKATVSHLLPHPPR